MIVRINTKTEIMWEVVLLYFVQKYVLNAGPFFLLSLLLIAIYTIYKRKIVLPKIAGMWPYIIVLLFITVIGATKYPGTLIERDLFYEFGSLVIIVLGYYLFDLNKNKEKSMWKTICFIMIIGSFICIINGVSNLKDSFQFETFRQSFTQGIRTISILLPMLVGRKFLLHKKTFAGAIDIIAIFLWLFQILLNLSRTAVVNLVLGIVIFTICTTYKKAISPINALRMFGVIIIILGISTQIISNLPEEASERFQEKFENTLTEINSENQYKNISEAQSDWRGYEIQCAKNQWKKSDFITQIFGGGNGTLIQIFFIPDQWKDTVESQYGHVGITILHNTYYTLLIKGGIVCVVAFILFLFSNIKLGIKLLRDKSNAYLFEGIIIICIVSSLVLNAYVIRSLIEKGEDLGVFILLGWLNAKVHWNNTLNTQELKKKEFENERTI